MVSCGGLWRPAVIGRTVHRPNRTVYRAEHRVVKPQHI